MLPLLSQGSPNGDIPGRRPDLFEDPSPPVSKPSRKQVSRACDHCRARRVKCDHGNPCRPCRQKGLLCNSRGKFNDEARTLPQALEEIERLRRRIQELENQLEEARRQVSAVPTPSNSSPSTLDLQTQPTGSSASSTTSKATVPKKTWEGICTTAGRSEQTSYYGPSSSHYFIGRIGAFLNKALYQSFRTCQLEPRGMNMTLAGPTIHDEASSKTDRRGDVPKPSMSRTQEEYFLNLFWESHHANLPIIQEDEFRKLYDSLWTSARSYRKPSALVDIVLAISMQYGCAFLLRSSPNSEKHCHDDPSIAGRWYYRRCQTLLASELESPSITTLQCHLFSITYLCCASFQNMAHSTLAVAIRTAQTLGLHLEPPASMPRAERELRKRLWWVTYINESKTCIKLGRPISVQRWQITVTPISDDEEAASFWGSSLGSYDGVTWLTYLSQVQKIIAASLNIYDAFCEKSEEVLGQSGHSNPYKEPKDLETCAKFLCTQVPALHAWADQVPPGSRLQRRDAGASFSVDRKTLIMDSSAPIWLQRHRICLELIYHTLQSNLHRPFINFAPPPGTYTPTAERHAVTCANHAAAYTHILHQTMQETDLMNGWQEFFIWQWNATVNMVGFVLACPINAATSNIRRAIDKAVEVFEVFGSDFAIAASAATLTKGLIAKADLLMEQLRSGITAGAETGVVDDAPDGLPVGDSGNCAGEGEAGEEGLTEFMDWALTVDAFNNFEDLFADANASMDFWGVAPV